MAPGFRAELPDAPPERARGPSLWPVASSYAVGSTVAPPRTIESRNDALSAGDADLRDPCSRQALAEQQDHGGTRPRGSAGMIQAFSRKNIAALRQPFSCVDVVEVGAVQVAVDE